MIVKAMSKQNGCLVTVYGVLKRQQKGLTDQMIRIKKFYNRRTKSRLQVSKQVNPSPVLFCFFSKVCEFDQLSEQK